MEFEKYKDYKFIRPQLTSDITTVGKMLFIDKQGRHKMLPVKQVVTGYFDNDNNLHYESLITLYPKPKVV